MAVRVYKAGSDREAATIDHLRIPRGLDRSDRCDAAFLQQHVRGKAGRVRAVENRSVS
jgi:hypothetical protein